MPNIIYYSRAIHRYPKNTCHVSTNVSWSWSTLKSKKSKNCLIWLILPPGSWMPTDHWVMCHTPGPIFFQKKCQGITVACMTNRYLVPEGPKLYDVIWLLSLIPSPEFTWKSCAIAIRTSVHLAELFLLILSVGTPFNLKIDQMP